MSLGLFPSQDFVVFMFYSDGVALSWTDLRVLLHSWDLINKELAAMAGKVFAEIHLECKLYPLMGWETLLTVTHT